MLKVIVDLLTRRPDLLVEHATAYVELISRMPSAPAPVAAADHRWRDNRSACVTTLIVCGITATLCQGGHLAMVDGEL